MHPAIYRRLTETVAAFRAGGGRRVWIKSFLDALEWHNSRVGFRTEAGEGTDFRLSVDGRPLVNVLIAATSDVARIAATLNLSYNQDVPWVLTTNFDTMALFGSYWISSQHDLSPAVAWSLRSEEYLLEIDKLTLLTPDEIARNRLGELYDAYEFRPRRLPIDVHLVDRMSHWRELAFESLSGATQSNDELVHRLISNLFLVRYLEDSQLIPNDLGTPARLQETDSLRTVKSAFAAARRVVGSSALPHFDVDTLSVTPLRTLIQQLYGYEEYRIRYDFRAMSTDVLGRFYEEYLRRQPGPIRIKKESPVQPLFFEPDWEFSDIRSQRGIYYTPRFIVDYIVNGLLARAVSGSKGRTLRVLDLACGSGTFLASAIDWLRDRGNLTPEAVANMCGTDIDARAIDAARVNITAHALSSGITRKELRLNLAAYDLLDRGVDNQFFEDFLPNGGVDIIMGNPPFINYETLTAQYDVKRIASLFETAAKRFDSHMLFLEAAVRLLGPGGFCGFVLPSGFLRSAAGGKLREWISERADLLEIIDFGDQPVFQGVNVYICLLLLRRRSSNVAEAQLSVARIRRLSPTPGAQLATLAVQSNDETGHSEVYFVEQPTGTTSWTFRNPRDRSIIEKLRSSAAKLETTSIDIRQGIKTGADPVLLVSLKGSEIGSGEKSDRSLQGLLLPVFRGRDLKRWYSKPALSVIYPYDLKERKLLSWRQISETSPLLTSYLQDNRKLLEKRRSLRKSIWYALIEPRLATVASKNPKCFISELSVWPTVSVTDVHDAAVLGGAGGGSWLVFTDDTYDVYSMIAYLNSVVVYWLLQDLAPTRRGGWLIIEQSTLRQILIPNFLSDSESYARQEFCRLSKEIIEIVRLGADPVTSPQVREREIRINSVLVQALGLSATEAQYIFSRATKAGFRRKLDLDSDDFALLA